MKRSIEIEDMIWAIKLLMMSKEEIKRMITNFRNAILEFNKEQTIPKLNIDRATRQPS